MNQKKKVLHVGCSNRAVHERFNPEGWDEVRLDIDASVKPDVVASMLDMKMLENGSFDAVWSSHNLEHLYPHEVPVALAEFQRVLKNGGYLFITMPDLQRVAEYIAKGNLEEHIYVSGAGPISPIDILYGFRPALKEGNYFMAHKTGFTAKTLGQKLMEAGFKRIEIQRTTFDLWAIGYKSAIKDNEEKIVLVEQAADGSMTKKNILENEFV